MEWPHSSLPREGRNAGMGRPRAASKKWNAQRRSSSRKTKAAVRAGSEKTTENEVVSVLYMNSGMRLIVMPGARSRKIVTMKLIAPAVVEMVRRINAKA